MANKQKQAVLLIHGIGEQRPMDTLRGFVKSVWTTDKDVKHAHAVAGVFSKPDEISGSFELRRLTTTKNANNVRTDFFEFYWAHMMEGNSVKHVVAWAKCLLLRWPWTIPKRLIGAWLLLMGLIAVMVFFVLQTVLPETYRIISMPKWLTALFGLFVLSAAFPMIRNVIGGAARYLNPVPSNIHQREEIRKKGVAILKKMHDSQEYDRIIVVGHSLGSVIGYDILTYAWSLYNEQVDRSKPHPALDALEAKIQQTPLDAAQYQAAQRQLQKELKDNGNPWCVTDFLSLGSPLTHAEILMAQNTDDLFSKQADRELPRCPPMLESGKFSYPPQAPNRTLHHAAVFGPTRWTNVYFPARKLVFGDLIGGPLREIFGAGICDIAVETDQQAGLFSHNLYWSADRADASPASHIVTLRNALNLLDNR